MYEKYKLGKISQLSKVASFLNFIYWFDLVFGKSRQRISTRNQAFSILLNWEQCHLLYIFLIVKTLEEVRRWHQPFVGFQNKKFWTKIFNLTNIGKSHREMVLKAGTEAYLCYYSSCGLEKIFYIFIFT